MAATKETAGKHKIDSVEQSFELYRKIVIPKDAGETQIEETKKAFYAGGWAVFKLMCDASDREDEEVSVDRIDRINSELIELVSEYA
jgi:hypothetical protein